MDVHLAAFFDSRVFHRLRFSRMDSDFEFSRRNRFFSLGAIVAEFSDNSPSGASLLAFDRGHLVPFSSIFPKIVALQGHHPQNDTALNMIAMEISPLEANYPLILRRHHAPCIRPNRRRIHFTIGFILYMIYFQRCHPSGLNLTPAMSNAHALHPGIPGQMAANLYRHLAPPSAPPLRTFRKSPSLS